MTVLAFIGIIALVLILFTGGGILGWMLRAVEGILGLLWDGNMNCLGCIFRIIVGLFLIGAAITML